MTKVFIITLQLIFLMSCNNSHSNNAHTNILTETVAKVPIPENSETPIVKEEGWQIPELKNSKIIKREKLKNHEFIYHTKYIIKGRNRIDQSFYTEAEREALRIFKGELTVHDLISLDFQGKTYCYIVLVNPPGIGANTTLRFYDSDGDGKFESADNEYLVYIPSWTK